MKTNTGVLGKTPGDNKKCRMLHGVTAMCLKTDKTTLEVPTRSLEYQEAVKKTQEVH